MRETSPKMNITVWKKISANHDTSTLYRIPNAHFFGYFPQYVFFHWFRALPKIKFYSGSSRHGNEKTILTRFGDFTRKLVVFVPTWTGWVLNTFSTLRGNCELHQWIRNANRHWKFFCDPFRLILIKLTLINFIFLNHTWLWAMSDRFPGFYFCHFHPTF